MNLSEFRAWFEGYTENMNGVSSKKQWERIQEHVKEIRQEATSYPVYIRDYWQPWWNLRTGISYTMAASSTSIPQNAISTKASYTSNAANFDSLDAFRELGRAEAVG